ncbi:hypothetical protein C8K36_102451 [Rhodococcus sp. OK519]|uniref:hypothetical protein n=1 Tax=Rhodococcus sp. OK519 TaxID=2135729 RepID=UPI000D3F2283|nr:hypothetical protein C8K36_102451 [Rhodococcus sp. OK519]
MTDSTVDLSVLTKVEDLPEWAQTEIKDLRKESQGLRSRLGDAETALSAKDAEIEQKATAFQSQIDDLTGKHSAAETALAKTSLAVSKGLPLNVVPMIVGASEDEWKTSADALAALASSNGGVRVDPAQVNQDPAKDPRVEMAEAFFGAE